MVGDDVSTVREIAGLLGFTPPGAGRQGR
jgi:hypothetical protein